MCLESGFWAVTGYDAAMEALRHRACGSSPIAARYLDGLPPGAARDEMSRRINFLDPPDHTRVRALVSKAFTPRRIAGLRPWMVATAAQLLDGLDGRATRRSTCCTTSPTSCRHSSSRSCSTCRATTATG